MKVAAASSEAVWGGSCRRNQETVELTLPSSPRGGQGQLGVGYVASLVLSECTFPQSCREFRQLVSVCHWQWMHLESQMCSRIPNGI